MAISLCNLELNLMIAVAEQYFPPVYKKEIAFDLEAIEIGLGLGSRSIGLSPIMREVLDNIRLLDVNVYDAFVYAYNGALEAN